VVITHNISHSLTKRPSCRNVARSSLAVRYSPWWRPGPPFVPPTWAWSGQKHRRRPSLINGWERFLGDQNPCTRPVPWTLAHHFIFFSPVSISTRKERASKVADGRPAKGENRGGGTADEAAHRSVHSSECAVVEPSLGGVLRTAPVHGTRQLQWGVVNGDGRSPSQCWIWQ
jgi:hypothetical protein